MLNCVAVSPDLPEPEECNVTTWFICNVRVSA